MTAEAYIALGGLILSIGVLGFGYWMARMHGTMQTLLTELKALHAHRDADREDRARLWQRSDDHAERIVRLEEQTKRKPPDSGKRP